MTAALIHRRAWRSFSVVAGLLMAIAVGIGPAQSARAATGIEFSSDGITFSSVFAGSLFQDVALMVPGDVQTSTFWVRNTSASAGYLRAVLSDVTVTDPMLANAISVTSSTPSRAGTPVRLGSAAPCWVLTEGDVIPAGSSVKVTSTLALANLTGMNGQGESADVSIRVGLSDVAVGSLPPTSCGGTSTTIPAIGAPPVMAMTGSEFPYPLLTLGAGALGVGLFLLIAARRRRQEEA